MVHGVGSWWVAPGSHYSVDAAYSALGQGSLCIVHPVVNGLHLGVNLQWCGAPVYATYWFSTIESGQKIMALLAFQRVKSLRARSRVKLH